MVVEETYSYSRKQMIRFTKYSQSDKYSFLNNLLPDSYEYAKVFRPWALIYAILLITTLILSHFFYSSVIEFFVRAIGKTGADWDSAPEEAGTLLTMQS